MKPLLAIDGVACIRGGRLLFEGLDVMLAPGAAAVVRGPNGAGKSSLLRIAAGLLRASAGSVRRSGAALSDEALALDRKLTLGRALGFWAKLDGGDAGTAMTAMGLATLSDVPVHMLSNGQRRRASLARVIASRAELWLLDEPANGLDSEGVELMEAVIESHRGNGGAVLAASHHPLSIADAQHIDLGG